MSRAKLAAHRVTIGYLLDFVTFGAKEVLAEGGFIRVRDPLRACRHRRP
jgi:hypothetical protein